MFRFVWVFLAVSMGAFAFPSTNVLAQVGSCYRCGGCFEEMSCCEGAEWGYSTCMQQEDFCLPYGDICDVVYMEDLSPDGSLALDQVDLILASDVGGIREDALDVGQEVVRRVCDGGIVERRYAAEVVARKARATLKIII